MNLLLDTPVVLWWDQQSPSLGDAARAVIADRRNNVYVSAVSVWEIAIKRRTGKLIFRGVAAAAIGANGFLELPIGPADAEQAGDLPWDHGDPFDRMLVAQAMRADLILVTADRSIRAYDRVAHMVAGRGSA